MYVARNELQDEPFSEGLLIDQFAAGKPATPQPPTEPDRARAAVATATAVSTVQDKEAKLGVDVAFDLGESLTSRENELAKNDEQTLRYSIPPTDGSDARDEVALSRQPQLGLPSSSAGAAGQWNQVQSQLVAALTNAQTPLDFQQTTGLIAAARNTLTSLKSEQGADSMELNAEALVQRILFGLARHPGESPDMMFFRYWGDNPFEEAILDAKSTFAMDVDTASYSLVRNYLSRGILPPKAAVRTEEFLNSFDYKLTPPSETQDVFAIHLEAGSQPFWRSRHEIAAHWLEGQRIGRRPAQTIGSHLRHRRFGFYGTRESVGDGERVTPSLGVTTTR